VILGCHAGAGQVTKVFVERCGPNLCGSDILVQQVLLLVMLPALPYQLALQVFFFGDYHK
jgi:hypothetical protein